jgi:hypothetical protein
VKISSNIFFIAHISFVPLLEHGIVPILEHAYVSYVTRKMPQRLLVLVHAYTSLGLPAKFAGKQSL